MTRLPAAPLGATAPRLTSLGVSAALRRLWARLWPAPSPEILLARRQHRAALRAQYDAQLDLYLGASMRGAPWHTQGDCP